MKTERLQVSGENINRAGEIIREGGLVAFPTETVYGLGADALNEEAVKSIYMAKGRPSDNPMIVHIADFDMLEELTTGLSVTAVKLMDAFWPGPITFVLKKSEAVPYVTTGGLDTVAIRFPSGDVAQRLIKAAQRPIAAPSANISGKPSPTTALDVLEDMDGRIDAVIMGDTCDVGIESTVCDLTGDVPTILRPGYITAENLSRVLCSEVRYDEALYLEPTSGDFHPKSPGMKYKHYSPRADVKIVEGGSEAVSAKIIGLKAKYESEGMKVAVINYGGDSRKAAHDFFAELRELDREGYGMILVAALTEDELGFSVMNRMLKSAGYDVIKV